MERAFDTGVNRLQWPATDNLTTFFFHYLGSEPVAHVFVGCRPEEANDHADFSYRRQGRVRAHRAPAPGDWELTLQSGEYEFIADFPGGMYNRVTKNWQVHPPYRKVPLKVQ